MSSIDLKELNFLVLYYLQGVCTKEVFEPLAKHLESTLQLPTSTDWKGNDIVCTLSTLIKKYNHISPNHLVLLLDTLLSLGSEKFPIPGFQSLTGEDEFSLLKLKNKSYYDNKEAQTRVSVTIDNVKRLPTSSCNSYVVSSLYSRELGAKNMKTDVWPMSIYNKYKELKVVRGHKAAVYCLLFDRSSSRMITGSDDKLVKIWGVYNGRLIKSLRGHLGDITDLAINYDNSILASADNLHSLRLWNFNEYLPIAVLQTDSTTFIGFSPSVECNFLISTDEQGTCKIWNCEKKELDKETIEPLAILTPPVIIDSDVNDKHKILCCSITKGGSRFVTSGDSVIRMWSINPPSFLCNLVGHTAPVRTLQWNSTSDRLLSGSEDSTVRIWHFENNKWNNKIFKLNEDNETNFTSFMVLWSYQDRYILSSCGLQTNTTTQSFIKIWDTSTGQLIHTLKEHSQIVYSLEIHPQDKNIFLSAGYDGLVILWDINKGIPLQKFQLYQDVELTDAKFSSDGLYFATCDIMGFLTLYGTGLEEYYKNTYKEQFFSTDYNPLIHDANGIAIDQNSQVPPHLMEVGLLCDWTGDVHPIQPIDNVNMVVPYNYDEFQFERTKREESLRKEVLLKYLPANPLEAPIKIVIEKKKRRNRRSQNEDTFVNTQIHIEEEEEEPPSSSESDDDKEVSFSLEEEESDEEIHYNNNNLNKDIVIKELRERESIQKKDMEEWLDDREDEEEEEEEHEEEDYYEDKEENRNKEDEEEEEEEEEIIYDNSEDDVERDSLLTEDEFDDMGRVNTRQRLKEKKKRKLESKQTQSNRLRRSKRRKAPYEEANKEEEEEEEEDVQHKLPEEEEELSSEETSVNSSIIPISSRRKKNTSTPDSWANWQLTIDDTIYSPQIGDKVYYFAKAHEIHGDYEDKLPKTPLPSINNPNIIFSNKDLCQITNIKYSIGNPSYCILDLVLMNNNSNNNKEQQFKFQVNFLPGSNFPDWIVLASKVEESIKFPWKEGLLFKMLNGVEEPWEGIVESIIKLDYQSDPWESIQINWNLSTLDSLSVSPWEIDPLNEETNTYVHFKHNTIVESISREEKERLLEGLKLISEFTISNLFVDPVSIEEFPGYLQVVPHPMDLSILIKRLQNNYYRCKDAFLFDCKLIYQNALLFNESASSIVQDAAVLNTILLDLYHGIDPVTSLSSSNTTTTTTRTNTSSSSSSSSTPKIKIKPPRKPLTIKLRKNVSDTWETTEFIKDEEEITTTKPTRTTRSSSRLAATTTVAVPEVGVGRRPRRSATTQPINYEELEELEEDYMLDLNNNSNNDTNSKEDSNGNIDAIVKRDKEDEEEYIDIENEEEEFSNAKYKKEESEEEMYNSEEYEDLIEDTQQRRRSTRLLTNQLGTIDFNKKYHLRER